MRSKLAIAILMASTAPLCAQTAVGVGTARSDSTAVSGSRSTAIGGGNATSHQRQSQSVTIGGAPASTSNSTTVHNSGSISNVPTVFAPGLTAAGLETCLGSVSAGVSWLGTGLSGGGTIPDAGCAARLDARTLWSMGLKGAAVARLCLQTDIYNSMPDVCVKYMPRPVPTYAPVLGGPTRVAAVEEAPPPYRGGPILLVEGTTGKERLCNNYDEPAQRCKRWASVIVHKKPKTAIQAIESQIVVTPPAATEEGK